MALRTLLGNSPAWLGALIGEAEMTEPSRRSRRNRTLANAIAMILACIGAHDAVGQRTGENLKARMQTFLAAIDTIGPTGLSHFFPRSGDFEYRRTIYKGADTIYAVWRFPAHEVERAIDGPLWESLEVQWEGQRLGLFADQARRRRGCWRRVANDRFIPPGAGVKSAIYVDWRLEEWTWVISVIADEEFASEPLPAWAFPPKDGGPSMHPEFMPEPRPCISG